MFEQSEFLCHLNCDTTLFHFKLLYSVGFYFVQNEKLFFSFLFNHSSYLCKSVYFSSHTFANWFNLFIYLLVRLDQIFVSTKPALFLLSSTLLLWLHSLLCFSFLDSFRKWNFKFNLWNSLSFVFPVILFFLDWNVANTQSWLDIYLGPLLYGSLCKNNWNTWLVNWEYSEGH